MRVFLVYQPQSASVFEVDHHSLTPYGRNTKRLFQGDKEQAAVFVRGMAVMGAIIRTAHTNKYGVIDNSKWNVGPGKDNEDVTEN